jgi:hypothetical protein
VTFPIGYHRLHPDASMNFQMNRWFGWVGEPQMEMRTAAARIATYADWKREFLALAERAAQPGRVLRAAFYCQVGNYGLALRTIVNWLDEFPVEKRATLQDDRLKGAAHEAYDAAFAAVREGVRRLRPLARCAGHVFPVPAPRLAARRSALHRQLA